MAKIHLHDVSVDYPIYSGKMQSLRYVAMQGAVGGLIGRDRKKRPVINALRGITLDIEDGERVGLIGRNGAGKTTLLRILAGICIPSQGDLTLEGKISSMMNAATFMDQEMTGYENIDLMGLMLGFSSEEIKVLTPEIAEFTELGDYLDMPVRTYSSGMMVRLSFAVITTVNPDILILDEAISAGDAHFVDKAMKRAQELYSKANIIVMASHSDDMIRKMCTRAIFMEQGRIRYDGPVEEALERYRASRTDI